MQLDRFLSSVVLATGLCLSTASASSPGTKPKVAILDFSATGLSPEKAKSLTASLLNIVAAEASKLGYDVISSADINAMLAMEKQRDVLGCADNVSCLAEIGGALGTDLMVSGSVSLLGDSYSLSLSLIDSKRAQVKQRFQGSAGSEGVLSDTARRGVAVLFGKQADTVGTGTLLIKTVPDGAQVTIDGRAAGASPVTLDEVSAGDHLIVATSGDLSARSSIYLQPEAIERVTLTLEGAPPVKLKVLSSPPEASVFLDGTQVGATPLLLPEVRPGLHSIRVTLAGYDDGEQTISLSQEEYERGGKAPLKHNVKLVPAAVAFSVSGLPEGAEVKVDGVVVSFPSSCRPGKHQITIRAHGYEPHETAFDAMLSKPVELTVTMKPLAVYQTYLEGLDSKRFHMIVGTVAGGLLTVGGGAALLMARGADAKAADAHAAYGKERDDARIQQLYDDVESKSQKASMLSRVGFGLLGAAAVGFGYAAFSRATYPSEPVLSLDVGAERGTAMLNLLFRVGE